LTCSAVPKSSLAAGVALIVLTVACASSQSGSSSRFVKKADGFIELGSLRSGEGAAATPAAEWERAKRHALAARAAAPKPGLPSVEDTDPALRTALAMLKASESAGGHLAVAEHYNRLRVRDMAYDHFSKALAIEPKSVPALDGRARLLRVVGLMNMALGDVHRALFIEPRSAAVKNTLGTILEKLGQCREASAAYREAARLSGGAEWAEQNVTRLSASCPG
jgi:tetratricopeptide (TPR) repeat protein